MRTWAGVVFCCGLGLGVCQSDQDNMACAPQRPHREAQEGRAGPVPMTAIPNATAIPNVLCTRPNSLAKQPPGAHTGDEEEAQEGRQAGTPSDQAGAVRILLQLLQPATGEAPCCRSDMRCCWEVRRALACSAVVPAQPGRTGAAERPRRMGLQRLCTCLRHVHGARASSCCLDCRCLFSDIAIIIKGKPP